MPVHVVGRPTGVLRALAGFRPLLAEAERARAAAFRRDEDRNGFLAARLLARTVVGELTGAPAAEVTIEQLCPTCGDEGHGPPRATVRAAASDDTVHVSWSHARGYVAASAASVPVGVDIEDTASRPPPVSDLAFSVAELEELRRSVDPGSVARLWWTRKEALVKLGLVSLDDLHRVDVRGDHPFPGVVLGSHAGAGWVASVAIRPLRQTASVESSTHQTATQTDRDNRGE